jgi:RNA polymerase primary sigma factor
VEVEQRNKLIIEHLALIKLLASKFKQPVQVTEDLVQEGVLGLIRATETFDDTKDAKFITYASYWIKAYMTKFLKHEFKYVPTSNDLDSLVEQVMPSVEQVAIQKDLRSKLAAALEIAAPELKQRGIDIVLARYLDDTGITFQQLGDRYGVSKQRIEQIERQMLNKLKKKVQQYD